MADVVVAAAAAVHLLLVPRPRDRTDRRLVLPVRRQYSMVVNRNPPRRSLRSSNIPDRELFPCQYSLV